MCKNRSRLDDPIPRFDVRCDVTQERQSELSVVQTIFLFLSVCTEVLPDKNILVYDIFINF